MRAVLERPVARPSAMRSLRIATRAGVHDVDPYAAAFAASMRLRPGERVLDLGCGAGPYGLAAAARGARVVATDIDPDAVACTLENAWRNGLAGRVEGRVGSGFEPVAGERFDAIAATLPQLPAPTPLAVPTRYGGRDGLDLLRVLARSAPAHLEPGGRLYSLVTGWAGPGRVSALLAAEGFRVRVAERTRRAFQPSEYEGYLPGLFDYLDALAGSRGGEPAYLKSGSWCYLSVVFLEATLP